jgi:hypothetical protein
MTGQKKALGENKQKALAVHEQRQGTTDFLPSRSGYPLRGCSPAEPRSVSPDERQDRPSIQAGQARSGFESRSRAGLRLHPEVRHGATRRRRCEWEQPQITHGAPPTTDDAEWMSGKSRARLAPVLTEALSWMSDRHAYRSDKPFDYLSHSPCGSLSFCDHHALLTIQQSKTRRLC